MRRILLLTNLPQRDMATDALLATHLRNAGCDVRHVPFLPKPREHILYYKPDIVIGPEARCEFTVDMYRVCKEFGIQVVAKRTEGGAARKAWDVMDDAERKTVIGAWTYDVDLEIVWSKDFADLLAENGYIPRERIFAAGGLPFDVYFTGPTAPDRSHTHNILFATGWGHADRNPIYNVPEAPPDSPIHADAYKRHREGRDIWIKMMETANRKLSTVWNTYIRLKVGEHPTEYQQKLGSRAQIIMPCDTKVALQHTNLLIHAGSTMAIEAHLMGIPALSFKGLTNQTKGYNYPHVSPNFDNIDELIKAIKDTNLNKSNADTQAIATLEREFYGTIDGNAAKRAAERILMLEERQTKVPDAWPAEKKDYSFPDCTKGYLGWICETCGKTTYCSDHTRDMIKCLWCGISLARRTPNVPPQN